MATALRTLLGYGSAAGGTLNYDTFVVANTSNKAGLSSGGCCCLWTVPTGVTWFAVELWGGGGGGAGQCCCHQGWPGGSGSYARKFIKSVTAGQQFTICAAGSTGCSNVCIGCVGFPSFVSISGGAVQVCASGGASGGTRCYFGVNCSYSGCSNYQCGSWTGTWGVCGQTGGGRGSSFCNSSAYGLMPSAPYAGMTNRPTMSYCNNGPGCCVGGEAHWPGGGGASVSIHDGSAYCGAPGAGGLVTIFYPILTA